MLVLSRKCGEKIYIGDDMTITIVAIERGKIRLGIEAPREVPIYRSELLSKAKVEEHDRKVASDQSDSKPKPTENDGIQRDQPNW